MKIFSRGPEAAKPTTAQTAPTAAPTSAAPSAPAAPAQPAPPSPDIAAILEANVKDMSEKIARLASSLEGDQSGRSDFEAKLEKMEERMRKLSSLTEMISAQYNPFVGAAPNEREPFPAPDVGLAAPPSAPIASAAALMPPFPTADAAPAASPLQIALDDPLASVAAALAAPPEEIAVELAPPPVLAPPEHPAPSFEAIEPPVARPAEAAEFRLWASRSTFESSMLMLNWADLLLKHAPSREAYLQLIEYYHNIGWIGDPARDQLLAYADGIRHEPKSEAGADWRASSEIHEKSLLFVEKLRAIAEGRRER